MPSPLTASQAAVVNLPATGRFFLEGQAGAGKTTAGVQRLLRLLKDGVPGGSILVLVPQRTLAAPYSTALRRARLRAGGLPSIQTAGGLARRMVELFWPLAAGPAGFADPNRPPTFLTLETAQYHMARLVRPLLDDGYFEFDYHRPQPALQPDHRQPQQGRAGRLPAQRDRPAAPHGLERRPGSDSRLRRRSAVCGHLSPALPGQQPAGLLAPGGCLLASPVAAAHLPRASHASLPPPPRGQPGGGHSLRP